MKNLKNIIIEVLNLKPIENFEENLKYIQIQTPIDSDDFKIFEEMVDYDPTKFKKSKFEKINNNALISIHKSEQKNALFILDKLYSKTFDEHYLFLSREIKDYFNE